MSDRIEKKLGVKLFHTLCIVGANPTLKGFNMTIESVKLLYSKPGTLIMDLYKAVAEKYGIAWRAVERDIRSVRQGVNTGVSKDSPSYEEYSEIVKIIPITSAKTNAAFLTMLAEYLRREFEDEVH